MTIQMKRTKSIILFLLITIPLIGYSQKWKLSRTEIIGGIGTVNYFGDIGGSADADALWISDLDIMSTRPNVSVGLRYRLYDRFAVRGNLTYARFSGTDVGSLYEGRNYSFSTNLYELSAYGEFSIIPEKQMVKYWINVRDGLRKFNASLNVYVFAGIGVSYFKPKALDSFVGSTRFVDDKNFAIVMPLGLGLKYPITPLNNIGIELGGRFTSSDYIDGFKPDASESNDIYYFALINVTHKIKPKARKTSVRF